MTGHKIYKSVHLDENENENILFLPTQEKK